MFTRKMLSDEERSEYDAIFQSACYDELGDFRRTADAALLLLQSVRDAIQAQRTWASYLHDSFVMIGYQSAARRWQNEQRKHKTIIDGKLVTKKDAIRLSKITDTGTALYQTSLLEDATSEDLEQIIQSASVRVASERATIRDAMRLLDLIEETGETTVRGALKRVNKTLDEFLTATA